MHPAHQRMVVCIDREHRVAFYDFTRAAIQPGVPQARQAPWGCVGAPEAPPHVLARFPAGFIKTRCGDDASLTLCPGLSVRRLMGQFFSASVVCGIREPRPLCKGRNQCPLADNELSTLRGGAYERAGSTRVYDGRPDLRRVAAADVPVLLNNLLIRCDVSVAHGVILGLVRPSFNPGPRYPSPP